VSKSATILITGGAGFIGSHTCVDLLEHGYEVVVVDDYSNSTRAALDRVTKLAGHPITAYDLDLRDRHKLTEVFRAHPFDAVIHFAAKKAVGESLQMPLEYYDINIGGTLVLLEAMRDRGVHGLVFSSSCSIYGQAKHMPIAEEDPPAPTNPYARSKWICEQVLTDACARYPDLSVVSLRYFNPIGAHHSGLLGEDPINVPNNVMPYLTQVAIRRRERLNIFGQDYPTIDGTCVRDYIHVMDVAEGHRVALEHLDDEPGMSVFNLGTGVGTSVLELVAAFSEYCGTAVPYRVVARRPGDVAELVANPARAAQEWNWRTKRDLAAMCRDAWNFQRLNPAGYNA
jgi:UDP-glucose 4-epimerase